MQRVTGGISVAQGPNCSSLWRSVRFGCYRAWMANAAVYENGIHPSLIAVPQELTQSSGCPVSPLQNLVSNHISLKTVFLQASTDIHSSEERLQAWFTLILCHSSSTEVSGAAPPASTRNGSGSAVGKCCNLSWTASWAENLLQGLSPIVWATIRASNSLLMGFLKEKHSVLWPVWPSMSFSRG